MCHQTLCGIKTMLRDHVCMYDVFICAYTWTDGGYIILHFMVWKHAISCNHKNIRAYIYICIHAVSRFLFFANLLPESFLHFNLYMYVCFLHVSVYAYVCVRVSYRCVSVCVHARISKQYVYIYACIYYAKHLDGIQT